MKWLVYLLLLANVGLLAFELRHLEPGVDQVPGQAQSNGVKRLLLLSEVDPARLEPAGEEHPAVKPGSASDDTYSSDVASDPDEPEVTQAPPDVADTVPGQSDPPDEAEAQVETPDIALEPQTAFDVSTPFVTSPAAMERFALAAPDVAPTLDALSIAEEFAATWAQTWESPTAPTAPEAVDDAPPQRSPVSPHTQTPVPGGDPVAEALAALAPDTPVAADALAEQALAPDLEADATVEDEQPFVSAVEADVQGVEGDPAKELDVASAESALGDAPATDSLPEQQQAEIDQIEKARSDLSQVEDAAAASVIASETQESASEDEAAAPGSSPGPESGDTTDGAIDDGSAPVAAPAQATKALAFSPPSGPAQEPVDALAAKPAQPVCYRVGPFSSANAAETGVRWLSRFAPADSDAAVMTASAIPEEVRERSAVWIFLPPFDSRADANEKMREMREKGVKDMYVVNEGDNKNAVSLGVYGHIPSLERRIATLREFGYDPQTIERYRTATVYWLDIRLERPSLLSANDLTTRFPDATTESRSCDGAF